MVGWAGAPQGAPVSDEAGKTNSAQSTTRKIGLFGGGDFFTHSSETALWLPSLPRLTRYLPLPSAPPRISPCSPITANTSPKT
ncbi:ash family protein [Dickeya dadantii]|uniref:ash family protein n=1 Tax=Dickeya dadantii TaxID=204038 RepID=UPI00191C65FD